MKLNIFRSVAGIAAAYHVFLGAAGILCPAETIEQVIASAFGVTLEVGPPLDLVIKFASVYVLAFGVMLLLLASNPTKYRALAIPALLLFGLRFVNRVLFFSAVGDAGVTNSRNLIGVGLILFFFVAILVTLPKKDS